MRRRTNTDLPPPPELPSFTVEAEPEPRVDKAGSPEGSHPGSFDDSRGDSRGGRGDRRGGNEAAALRHESTGLQRHDAPLDEDGIDPDAAKVVRRLERAGFQAYLVGGCVRDLLLNGRPKDFDVATSARPDDVRSLFRNCRIIGRRFRLAHVLFGGGKVVEVATFRKNPGETDLDEDLLIAFLQRR